MMEVRELANQIRMGKVSAEKVMRQSLELAATAHNETNCVTKFLSESAIKSAKAIDTRVQAAQFSGEIAFSEEEFPLLGVPFSVKDMLDVEGTDTVAGRSDFVGRPALQDAAIVLLLRKAGGIPFCKTNVPQFVWTAETYNPVFGTTTNPTNKNYTCGGSSGGEGALIGCGGSLLGVGSDIGGSLRFPAHFCGIYSFKPTYGRLPTQGHVNYFGGQEGIPAVVGPMANSVDSLEVFMRACLSSKPWESDLTLNPIPYQEYLIKKKLKVGYYTDDGNFPSSPSCKRAVNSVINQLQAAGHEVIPFNPPNVPEAFLIYLHIVNGDSMKSCLREMSSFDQYSKQCQIYFAILRLPRVIKLILMFILYCLGQTDASNFLATFISKSADEIWQLQSRLREYQRDFQYCWNSLGLDAVICPVSGLPAHPHLGNMDATPSFGYSMLFNLLDYPAGVLPVTRVKPGLDLPDNSIQSNCLLKQAAFDLYNPNEMAGLPIGIQVVAPRNKDEKVISIMKLIDQLIHNKP